MTIKSKHKTQQQIVLEQCDTPREYFYALLEAKRNNEEWVIDIPVDSVVYFADIEDIDKLKKLTKPYNAQ